MLPASALRWCSPIMLGVMTTLAFSTTAQASPRPSIRVTDAGILEISPINPRRFETVAPAIVQVETDRPLRLEVLPAVLHYGPDDDPSGTQHYVTVRYGGHQVSSQSRDRTLEIPAGLTELEISIQVERPNQFYRGDYTYAFSLAVVD